MPKVDVYCVDIYNFTAAECSGKRISENRPIFYAVAKLQNSPGYFLTGHPVCIPPIPKCEDDIAVR